MSLNPPYTPINKPIKETVPFNGADFKTSFWPVKEGSPVKGRIVFVHGFSEYDAVYVRLFDDLSSEGYEVFFFDQRGAGLTSPGKLRGITNEHDTFNDLDFFIEKNLKEIKDREDNKIFLCGHSMGGGIALSYGVHGKYRDHVKGILVTGPLISLHPGTKPSSSLFFLMSLAMRIAPNYTMDSALKHEYITSDPEWRHFVTTDPLIVPQLGSLKQIHDFIVRGDKLLNASYVKDFSIPVLILHGKDDKINDPEASRKFIDLIPVKDKKLTVVDKGRHALFIEKEEIYRSVKADTLEWLSKH